VGGQLLFDDSGNQVRLHRGSVGPEAGKGVLPHLLVGLGNEAGTVDERQHLTELHDGALHSAHEIDVALGLAGVHGEILGEAVVVADPAHPQPVAGPAADGARRQGREGQRPPQPPDGERIVFAHVTRSLTRSRSLRRR
jgi:hypothetical protein